MIAKKYRLNRKQINYIYRKGKNFNFGLVGVKSVPNTLGFSRFSVIIPKAVTKKAVDRNRLRRLMYEELSHQKSESGSDNIIRLFKIDNEATIRSKIREIMSKINV